ncbi:MAG: hypothetical protein EBQ80_03515 [Proteobacteria bacterium]|nr:hypothetical protein [Pseudomonadota bacterium]
MPAKAKPAKKPQPTKNTSKINPKKPTAAPAKTPFNPLAMWLEDASLEVLRPASSYAVGERQLEFAVRANHATAQQGDNIKLTLLLRAHIHASNQTLAIAEISHSAIIKTLLNNHNLAESFAALYPTARQSLANLLALSGHNPPLPEALEANATKA